MKEGQWRRRSQTSRESPKIRNQRFGKSARCRRARLHRPWAWRWGLLLNQPLSARSQGL